MEIIGEDMHIMNQAFYKAMEDRDEDTVARLATR